MISALIELDEHIFGLINMKWQNGFFDFVMPYLRNKYFWIPFYLLFAIWLIIKFKKSSLVIILASIAVVGISDMISSSLIKKNVKRERPCRQLEEGTYRTLINCGSGYSFTSSHATNHFSLAVILILILGRFVKPFKWLLLWAGSIAYAQVYVGVHFPVDVIAGGVLGSLIALLMYKILERFKFMNDLNNKLNKNYA